MARNTFIGILLLSLIITSACALIITDDGRVVFAGETLRKTYTVINDTENNVRLNVAVPSLNESVVTRSAQSWLELPTTNMLVPAYAIREYIIKLKVPDNIPINTFWLGLVDFQDEEKIKSKPVYIFNGAQDDWVASYNMVYEQELLD
ncbi:MAG: hypothetical protein WC838_00355 [Candidatus Margulisiibacteriota bacterium]|jgi:hypothetical protein